MPAVTAALVDSQKKKKNNRGVFIDYKNYYGDYRYCLGSFGNPDWRHAVCRLCLGAGADGLV